MRVDIDEAGQDRKAAPVDLDCIAVVGRPSRADCGDCLPFDRQIDITTIAMGLRRLVPGDEPGGVANNFPRQGWFERIRHGIPSRPIARATFQHIRGLGFIGLLASGSHHQPHHLAMAKGEFMHSH